MTCNITNDVAAHKSPLSMKLRQVVLACALALTAACAAKGPPVRGVGRPVMRRPRPSMMAQAQAPAPAPHAARF
jgi:hypothetical protein